MAILTQKQLKVVIVPTYRSNDTLGQPSTLDCDRFYSTVWILSPSRYNTAINGLQLGKYNNNLIVGFFQAFSDKFPQQPLNYNMLKYLKSFEIRVAATHHNEFGHARRTICMRVELYGCVWEGGVAAYSMPQVI